MTQQRSNIVLIGMPGSGKSTIGVILAKKTSRNFVDTDLLIQSSRQRTLQNIVDTDGYLALRKIEAEVLCSLNVRNHVIATGGSAVYSRPSMLYLKARGCIIFLDVDLDTLESRVLDYSTRGLAKPASQSIDEMFKERFALYTKYADATIDCAGLTQEQVCEKIIEKLNYP